MPWSPNARPTNPQYTGAPHPDPRVHGPEFCKHRCDICPNGRHHWLEAFDVPLEEDRKRDNETVLPGPGEEEGEAEEEVEEPSPAQRYDKEHGTEHSLAYYRCKHCDTWAEAEFIFELEDEEEDDD